MILLALEVIFIAIILWIVLSALIVLPLLGVSELAALVGGEAAGDAVVVPCLLLLLFVLLVLLDFRPGWRGFKFAVSIFLGAAFAVALGPTDEPTVGQLFSFAATSAALPLSVKWMRKFIERKRAEKRNSGEQNGDCLPEVSEQVSEAKPFQTTGNDISVGSARKSSTAKIRVKPVRDDSAFDTEQIYTYCSVAFDEGGKTYYFLTDDASLKCGDEVIVPVGKGTKKAIGTIRRIEQCYADSAPFPPSQTKKILGKCDY